MRKINSRQLHLIVSNEKVTSRNFKSIYAFDKIGHVKQRSFSFAYVSNLDPSYKPGLHWVAFYNNRKGVPEYFDSFEREKLKMFCTPIHKAGTTIMSLFKNFIIRHVDNLLCFIFIKNVLA